MSKQWPKVSLGELLRLERRKVKVEPEKLYQEIGIYCFGRGIFHKAPRTGFEVGDKDLFLMKQGDFILQVTFAWEKVRLPSCRLLTMECMARHAIRLFELMKAAAILASF
jgi:hypothetical protein